MHWTKWRAALDNEHTHTRLTALFPGLPMLAGTREVKPIWILLKQEIVSDKSAPRYRQITMPALHRSVFYRPDALPATQPTMPKHRQWTAIHTHTRLTASIPGQPG